MRIEGKTLLGFPKMMNAHLPTASGTTTPANIFQAGGVSVWFNIGVTLAVTVLVLGLPFLTYATLVYGEFEYLRITSYFPYEELLVAMRSLVPAEIFNAPVLSANMTSGFIISSMYTWTVGQLFLSLALGIAAGLSLAGHLALRKLQPSCSAGGSAAATGCGVFASIGASGTGLLGCCAGTGLSGGIMALAGVSSTAASQIAGVAPIFQLLLIGLFAIDRARVEKRIRGLKRL